MKRPIPRSDAHDRLSVKHPSDGELLSAEGCAVAIDGPFRLTLRRRLARWLTSFNPWRNT